MLSTISKRVPLTRSNFISLPVLAFYTPYPKSRLYSTFNSTRTYSTTSTSTSASEEPITIYEGPFATAAKRLKMFSFSSLGLTLVLTPALFLSDAAIGIAPRTTMAAVALFTSTASTLAIHWCLSPYVARVSVPKPSLGQVPTLTPDTPITFETLSLTARPVYTTVPLRSLEPSTRMFTTWKVKKECEHMIQARNKKGKRAAGQKTFFLHLELLEGSKYYDKGGGELARIVRIG
ncbi:9522_t:CDS:2 [Paraglomus brasilianum]|uniref:9522_t:CDS:1 n=1 Tax=Paraglomus brasilianum TaxID=144538 RepID=A0A9N8WSS1_9GLOM|nr:9522_t:CDS:2 [Paraglomus brasilianum]